MNAVPINKSAPELREGRKRKLEAIELEANKRGAFKREASKQIYGDTQADKFINPSHHPQPSFGAFLILVVFLIPGGFALVFGWVVLGSEPSLDVFSVS